MTDREEPNIEQLLNKLESLRLRKEEITTQEQEVIAEIRAYNDKTKVSKTNDTSSTVYQNTTPNRRASFLDRNGINIDIGDRVEFLTKTRFKGTHGVVVRFSKQRVVSKNYEGTEVIKEGRNLLVVSKSSNHHKDGSASIGN